MITSSLVLYKSKPHEVQRVLKCVEDSLIEIIYVIDNSPTDDLRALVSQNSTKAKYIYGQGNVGFGEGNNNGIRLAMGLGSRYHIILNPDIIFKAVTIKNLSSFMDAHEDVGMIKPALTGIDGSEMSSAMRLPTPFTIFCRRLLPSSITQRINAYIDLKDIDRTVVREVPNFSGSFMFIRMSTLKKVGLFDNRYFMYFEDFDLARRIHKVSKLVFYPKEVIIHAHAAEHRTNKKLLLISIKAAVKYFNKWGWIFDSERTRWNKEPLKSTSIIN